MVSSVYKIFIKGLKIFSVGSCLFVAAWFLSSVAVGSVPVEQQGKTLNSSFSDLAMGERVKPEEIKQEIVKSLAEEKEDANALIDELSKYEKQLINSPKERKYDFSSTDLASQSIDVANDRMRQLIDYKRELEDQKEKLVLELVKHKRKIKSLMSSSVSSDRFQEKSEESQNLKSRLVSLESKLQALQEVEDRNKDLKTQLVSVLKEYQIIKNDLALKTEQLKSFQTGQPLKVVKQAPQKSPKLPEGFASVDSRSSDVMVAEVVANRVNLRSGPGREHAPVMQVARGAKLVVEDRKGAWYRVISPNGSRAYVEAAMLQVASKNNTSNVSSRARYGNNYAEEDAAFSSLRSQFR